MGLVVCTHATRANEGHCGCCAWRGACSICLRIILFVATRFWFDDLRTANLDQRSPIGEGWAMFCSRSWYLAVPRRVSVCATAVAMEKALMPISFFGVSWRASVFVRVRV